MVLALIELDGCENEAGEGDAAGAEAGAVPVRGPAADVECGRTGGVNKEALGSIPTTGGWGWPRGGGLLVGGSMRWRIGYMVNW